MGLVVDYAILVFNLVTFSQQSLKPSLSLEERMSHAYGSNISEQKPSGAGYFPHFAAN